jgi:cytidine deaminase
MSKQDSGGLHPDAGSLGPPVGTSDTDWAALSSAAWAARDNARVHGPTTVGAAVLSHRGDVFAGCNVEHRFRSHDVHAEVNALTTMAADGDHRAVAILVVAERDRFTPCGGCLDWIFELGGPSCVVAFQRAPGEQPEALRADELMPHYPY